MTVILETVVFLCYEKIANMKCIPTYDSRPILKSAKLTIILQYARLPTVLE